MATYWKSLPRYYCKYCNFWCVDNKINIQKHESSEIHRINVDRYLTKQKVTREREATREKEVEKIIKKAENEARDSMHKSHEANYNNPAVMDGRRMSNKRISSYLDSAPSFKITYDTVPTQEQWQASLYNNAPVVYDPNGNVPPPPPVGSMRVDSVSPSIPPPPPVGSGPLVYDPLTGNIPPPPPSVGSEETPSTDTSTAPPKETIKYNFDYESKLTEEDLFGSWKTVSVTKLTEKDLEKREEQYEKAIMKSSKEPVKKGVKPKKEQKKEDSEDEDEDEKDAFDMFNPFGGKYKGIDISAGDPIYTPKLKKIAVEKEEKEEGEKEVKKEESKQFLPTSISFSFAPKKDTTQKTRIKPVSESLSQLFSYHCFSKIQLSSSFYGFAGFLKKNHN